MSYPHLQLKTGPEPPYIATGRTWFAVTPNQCLRCFGKAPFAERS